MRIEISLLEQLETVAHYGTLSAASEAMHLTQPTLSRSMQKLEREIGAPLFERKKNKIYLNENGQIAREYANRILALEDEMIKVIDLQEKSRNRISFGSVAPAPLREIAPFLSDFVNGKRTSYEVKEEKDLLEGLRTDHYQLISLNDPIEDDNLFCRRIMSERIYYCFIPDEKGEETQSVYFKDLAGSDILMFNGAGFWKERIQANLPKSNIILVNDNEKLNLIAQHSDLAIISSDVAIRHNVKRPRRKAIPVLDEAAYTEYFCVCKNTNIEMIHFIKDLADILSDKYSEGTKKI